MVLCATRLSYRSFKSPLEAGKFIEHTAQSPDIALLVVRLPFTELWGDIAWSSHNLDETDKSTMKQRKVRRGKEKGSVYSPEHYQPKLRGAACLFG